MVVGNIHYLHFGVILFAISGVVTIIISLLTPPIPENSLYRYLLDSFRFHEFLCFFVIVHRLTFWSRHSAKIRVDLDDDAQNLEQEKGT